MLVQLPEVWSDAAGSAQPGVSSDTFGLSLLPAGTQ